MAAGKATGLDRRYQEVCRDILIDRYRDRDLRPYAGDGIDVTLRCTNGGVITFDVLLVDAQGNLLAAESKRTRKTPQKELFAFAFTLQKLREITGRHVDAVLYSVRPVQRGAVIFGGSEEIDIVTCGELQVPPTYGFTTQHSVPGSRRMAQHHFDCVQVSSGSKVWSESQHAMSEVA